jgi:predicted lipid-binding transport protein (Tim44 family)
MAAEAVAANKADKADKAKKDAKTSKKAAEGAAPESSGAPSVAAHPRAARAVARAKGWGGLVGFLLGGYLSLPTNTLAAAGLRALVAGVVCYVAVWAAAVFLWRRLVMLEIKGREQRLFTDAGASSARRQLPAAPERPNARAS